MQIIERVQLTFYGNNNKNYGEDVSIVCWLELEAMQTNKISIDRSTGQKLSLLRCEILMEVQSDRRLINAGYINRANFRRTDLKTHFSTSSSANDDNDLENQNLIPSRTSRAGAIRFKVLFSRFPEWKLSIQK